MSEALEKLLAQEPIKEPAKGWCNWYKVTKPFRGRQSGLMRKCGDIIKGTTIWPSKDTAETWATENADNPIYGEAKYLGAFPEGERP